MIAKTRFKTLPVETRHLPVQNFTGSRPDKSQSINHSEPKKNNTVFSQYMFEDIIMKICIKRPPLLRFRM